eukprot:PLAT12278.1.p3 GENE.PLAT12278.1~~PLAT12278.1.p3  ORF type:complete len:138 (+),score=56.90 PLAT12278.1:467-880(+)
MHALRLAAQCMEGNLHVAFNTAVLFAAGGAPLAAARRWFHLSSLPDVDSSTAKQLARSAADRQRQRLLLGTQLHARQQQAEERKDTEAEAEATDGVPFDAHVRSALWSGPPERDVLALDCLLLQAAVMEKEAEEVVG